MELITREESATALRFLEQAAAVANRIYNGSILLIGSNAGGERAPIVKVNRNGVRIRFALRTVSAHGPGHRLHIQYSWDGRPRHKRSHYACWHAHRDVLMALFDLLPTAKVLSGSRFVNGGRIVYNGKQGFLDTYRDTDRNIGSQMFPVYFSESCECEGTYDSA